jgi:hypothetical protein
MCFRPNLNNGIPPQNLLFGNSALASHDCKYENNSCYIISRSEDSFVQALRPFAQHARYKSGMTENTVELLITDTAGEFKFCPL